MDILEPGCSFAQMIAKINETVAWVNAFEASGISYNDLSDKPKIDNVELSATTGMKDLQIQLAQMPNNAEIVALFEQVAQNQAAEVAASTAESKIQEQLDIEQSKSTGIQPQDDWEIIMYSKNEAEENIRYKLSFAEFAEYTMNYINSKQDIVVGIPS